MPNCQNCEAFALCCQGKISEYTLEQVYCSNCQTTETEPEE